MKFGMIDQENATSLQTIEKGKNERERQDGTLNVKDGSWYPLRSKEDFENKTDHSQWRDRYKTGNKGCTGKRPDIL